jgi:hypothetical protein
LCVDQLFYDVYVNYGPAINLDHLFLEPYHNGRYHSNIFDDYVFSPFNDFLYFLEINLHELLHINYDKYVLRYSNSNPDWCSL